MELRNKKTGEVINVDHVHAVNVLLPQGNYESLDPKWNKQVAPIMIEVYDTQENKYIEVDKKHFENVLSNGLRYVEKSDQIDELKENPLKEDKPKKPAKKKPAKKKATRKKVNRKEVMLPKKA
jgi:hypothetical protein